MSNCKDCIHYEPCFEYGNILDPIHGGVKCDSFKPTADVVPRAEVERLLDDFQRTMRADARVGMSAGEILLHIGNMLVKLKKKYTEGDNQCAEERG